jgi:hypothetical protein
MVVECSEQSEELIETTCCDGDFDTSRISGTTQPPDENLWLSSFPNGVKKVSRQPVVRGVFVTFRLIGTTQTP